MIFGGAGRTIVIDRGWESDWFRVSVAFTVKLNGLPTVVFGVPEMSPVFWLRVNGGGNAPALIVQVRAPVPPFANTVWV